MSLVSNIDKVAFSSAFNIDKVFTTKFSGSFSVGASTSPGSLGNIASTTEAHTFGANVFPVMQFSTDNSNWYDMGSRKFTEGASLQPNFSATCYTTSSSLVIIGQNFTGSSQTCYYRAVLISDD